MRRSYYEEQKTRWGGVILDSLCVALLQRPRLEAVEDDDDEKGRTKSHELHRSSDRQNVNSAPCLGC
jgi:hypothetical protein